MNLFSLQHFQNQISTIKMTRNYLFKSERLGFRNWMPPDVLKLHEINTNHEVMRYFPSIYTKKQTEDFIQRMQHLFNNKGYCFFAVDELKSKNSIGFIGLSDIDYQANFTPCTEIGWRLHPNYWSKGYATEGAKCCLDFAFNTLKKESIKAIAPKINLPSIRVMEKIGMKKLLEFKHPALKDHNNLVDCVCYETNTP